ncbi:MAG: HemK/PrmC family methyltransferase [bacterium]|nr:HemK/PrmC family methyltransferase [bacterium]MDZ4285227.1 HemK/PrmC family methyltransferase [Patescibacteria group bacterium]
MKRKSHTQEHRTLAREQRWLLEEKYGGATGVAFLSDCERLERGEPIDYVVGWSEFLGCRIDLSERPLIPRPETEWWVEKTIKIFNFQFSIFKKSPLYVLDMFAGSGCIGLAVLKHIQNAHVDFADVDRSCLAQIRKNAELNCVAPERYRALRSDVFQAITGRYDVIFANPPYVAEGTAGERLAPSARDFEPHRALFAGADGLDYIRIVLRDASRFLAPRGLLAMEFDDTQADEVVGLLAHSNLRGSMHPDQYGRARYLLAATKAD